MLNLQHFETNQSRYGLVSFLAVLTGSHVAFFALLPAGNAKKSLLRGYFNQFYFTDDLFIDGIDPGLFPEDMGLDSNVQV